MLVKVGKTLFSNRTIEEKFNRELMNGVSVFKYKDYIVRIVHNKNEYLRLSCSSEDMLIELIPLGDEVMKSNIIAKYLMDSDDYNELMPTVEWSHNPSRRQEELRDGENLGFKCVNLWLNNNIQINNQPKGKVKKMKMGLF